MRDEPLFEFRLIHPEAKPPFRKRDTDAGFDLTAIADAEIPPRGFANVPTGIQIASPKGFFYAIEGRSSMWKNGIMTHHGIIDSGYTAEVFIGLYNLTDKPYNIKKGDRIGQLVVYRAISPEFVEVVEFSKSYSYRGESGWGSSGS